MNFYHPHQILNSLTKLCSKDCPEYCEVLEITIKLNGHELEPSKLIDLWWVKINEQLKDEEYNGEVIILKACAEVTPANRCTTVAITVGLDKSDMEMWQRWGNGV